jgi:hypothetical protein
MNWKGRLWMNNDYEEPLPLWQKTLNLFRCLIGLPLVSPILIAEVETVSADWTPARPKCLPAPPAQLLLPASFAEKE